MSRRMIQQCDHAARVCNQESFAHTANDQFQALSLCFCLSPQGHFPLTQTYIFQGHRGIICNHSRQLEVICIKGFRTLIEQAEHADNTALNGEWDVEKRTDLTATYFIAPEHRREFVWSIKVCCSCEFFH